MNSFVENTYIRARTVLVHQLKEKGTFLLPRDKWIDTDITEHLFIKESSLILKLPENEPNDALNSVLTKYKKILWRRGELRFVVSDSMYIGLMFHTISDYEKALKDWQ